MNNMARNYPVYRHSAFVSAYDDEGVRPEQISRQQREDNLEQVMQRFFAGNDQSESLQREAIARSLNPGADFAARLQEAEVLADGGFGPQLFAPSDMVAAAFREYARTELGAVALARLIAWDNRYITQGWRTPDGALTEAGIRAYGAGKWRPLRVASNGEDADTVTPSGALVLPDILTREYYSTGDIADPLAIIHHELKAHVLPLKEAKGLVPGREMELICIRLESEMLRELGMPARRLNWGRDDGTLDHTLHEASEEYFHGLVRYADGHLMQINPDTEEVLGPARVKAG